MADPGMPQLQPFPDDWSQALVVVAHPDDPEYGMAAAVSHWTRHGKGVDYVLASSGEAGIAGMSPEEAGPLREDEQRRSAARVGVDSVTFLGFADSRLENTPELREALAAAILDKQPQVVIGLYGGPRFAPDRPNQPDHIHTAAALLETIGALAPEVRPLWVFESSPQPTHVVLVDDVDIEHAVESLAEHDRYLSVLDPDTPVLEQARAQVEMVTREVDGRPAVGFEQKTI